MENIRESIEETLPTISSSKLCKIIITCEEPKDEEGNLEVSMDYQGDKILAAYLLKTALHQLEHSDPLVS